VFDASRIQSGLERLGAVGDVTVLGTVSSTNDLARVAGQEGAAHGAAFLADAQTQGRGRRGNTWHSPPGENIYLSILFRPTAKAPALASLTLAMGVAVLGVVDRWVGDGSALLKWPNDVYLRDKKLAGILVESTIQGDRPPVVVVGVGLNVRTTQFPPGLLATSLADAAETLSAADRDHIAGELIVALRGAYTTFAANGLAPFLPVLRARDFLRSKHVTVGDAEGTANGFDAEGRLLVGEVAVSSGEVTSF
jgi:BirA family biotin operon repressor/biotin-[acetyl-CoA-carboxylase] ligase